MAKKKKEFELEGVGRGEKMDGAGDRRKNIFSVVAACAACGQSDHYEVAITGKPKEDMKGKKIPNKCTTCGQIKLRVKEIEFVKRERGGFASR